MCDAEIDALTLSPRLFFRCCRLLEAAGPAETAVHGRPVHGLLPALHDGMLTAFMPAATRALVDESLSSVGLLSTGGDHAVEEEEEEEEAAAGGVVAEGGFVVSGSARVSVSVGSSAASRPELVPQALGFHSNRTHDRLLGTMLRAHAAGERALLLIGSQGVGKNRLADKLIGMLGREREYIQLHRDSTLSSLTLVPSLEGGQVHVHGHALGPGRPRAAHRVIHLRSKGLFTGRVDPWGRPTRVARSQGV